jgi:putative FmdB family regulatory protein
MPLYEYLCDACGRRFEVIQKFSDGPVDACRHCGKGPVHRQASSPAIQFKGTGWYITDYSDKGKASSESSSSKTKSKAEPVEGSKSDSAAAPAPASTPAPSKD